MTYCHEFFEEALEIHVAQWNLDLVQIPGLYK